MTKISTSTTDIYFYNWKIHSMQTSDLIIVAFFDIKIFISEIVDKLLFVYMQNIHV